MALVLCWSVTGQTGIPQQHEAGNIGDRMLCLPEAVFLFQALTQCFPSDKYHILPFFCQPVTFLSSVAICLFAHYFLSSQLSSITVSNQSDSSGLTRLLGVVFPGEKDRQEWEREQEEARRRDHRRIGTVR